MWFGLGITGSGTESPEHMLGINNVFLKSRCRQTTVPITLNFLSVLHQEEYCDRSHLQVGKEIIAE